MAAGLWTHEEYDEGGWKHDPWLDRNEYVRLLEALPPVKIRTSEQADATKAQIEALLARPALSAAERAYVDLLSDLLADCVCSRTTGRPRSANRSTGGVLPLRTGAQSVREMNDASRFLQALARRCGAQEGEP